MATTLPVKAISHQSPLAASQKMRQHRCRMRQEGLRPVRIWAPDARSPAMARELARQSRLASRSPDEQEVMAFLDAVRDWGEE